MRRYASKIEIIPRQPTPNVLSDQKHGFSGSFFIVGKNSTKIEDIEAETTAMHASYPIEISLSDKDYTQMEGLSKQMSNEFSNIPNIPILNGETSFILPVISSPSKTDWDSTVEWALSKPKPLDIMYEFILESHDKKNKGAKLREYIISKADMMGAIATALLNMDMPIKQFVQSNPPQNDQKMSKLDIVAVYSVLSFIEKIIDRVLITEPIGHYFFLADSVDFSQSIPSIHLKKLSESNCSQLPQATPHAYSIYHQNIIDALSEKDLIEPLYQRIGLYGEHRGVSLPIDIVKRLKLPILFSSSFEALRPLFHNMSRPQIKFIDGKYVCNSNDTANSKFENIGSTALDLILSSSLFNRQYDSIIESRQLFIKKLQELENASQIKSSIGEAFAKYGLDNCIKIAKQHFSDLDPAFPLTFEVPANQSSQMELSMFSKIIDCTISEKDLPIFQYALADPISEQFSLIGSKILKLANCSFLFSLFPSKEPAELSYLTDQSTDFSFLLEAAKRVGIRDAITSEIPDEQIPMFVLSLLTAIAITFGLNAAINFVGKKLLIIPKSGFEPETAIIDTLKRRYSGCEISLDHWKHDNSFFSFVSVNGSRLPFSGISNIRRDSANILLSSILSSFEFDSKPIEKITELYDTASFEPFLFFSSAPSTSINSKT